MSSSSSAISSTGRRALDSLSRRGSTTLQVSAVPRLALGCPCSPVSGIAGTPENLWFVVGQERECRRPGRRRRKDPEVARAEEGVVDALSGQVELVGTDEARAVGEVVRPGQAVLRGNGAEQPAVLRRGVDEVGA